LQVRQLVASSDDDVDSSADDSSLADVDYYDCSLGIMTAWLLGYYDCLANRSLVDLTVIVLMLLLLLTLEGSA